MPDPKVETTIDLAKPLDPQRKPEWYKGRHPAKFGDDLTQAFDHIQILQREKDRLRRDVMNLKLRNSLIVAAVTGTLSRLPEIVVFLGKLFR